MLCMWTYSIERTNLLLWVLSYLVVRSMMMATRQNKHETEKMGGKKIYIFVQYVLLFVIKYFNHSQCTKRMIQKLYLCVMFMYEYYLCSTELLIWRPFRLYVYIMRKYWATGTTHTPPLKSFHKRIYSNFKMRP